MNVETLAKPEDFKAVEECEKCEAHPKGIVFPGPCIKDVCKIHKCWRVRK